MLLLRAFANAGFSQVVSLWILVCCPSLGMGDVLSDSLMACAEITSDTARLTCFDRAIEETKKKASPSSPGVALTAEEKFGLSGGQVRGLEAKGNQSPTVLHAHIVSVSRYVNGRQVFVLDNVQTWQQTELDSDFDVRNGQAVSISKGVLGSFWLSADPHRATRVKRIQ
jgi:hypothetical protein